MYAVIDQLEASVGRAHSATKSAWDRLEVLRGALASAEGPSKGAAGGLAMVASLFKRGAAAATGGGAARAALDAPIRLPPYAPPPFDAAQELAALRACVGSAEALEAAQARLAAGGAAEEAEAAAVAAGAGAGAAVAAGEPAPEATEQGQQEGDRGGAAPQAAAAANEKEEEEEEEDDDEEDDEDE